MRKVIMARFADGLVTLGLMFLGVIVMVTPLALWVAWTDTILFTVLASGFTAGALYCVLIYFEKPPPSGRHGYTTDNRDRILPEQSISELQKLHPFVHHHRPSGGPIFRKVMQRLSRRLR